MGPGIGCRNKLSYRSRHFFREIFGGIDEIMPCIFVFFYFSINNHQFFYDLFNFAHKNKFNSIYSGQISRLHKKPHGLGVMQYKSGAKYVGYFKKGRKKGMGRWSYNNGDVFYGLWNKDEPIIGLEKTISGEIYNG